MILAKKHRLRALITATLTISGLFFSSINIEAADLGPVNQYIIVVDDSNRADTIAALRSAGANIDDTFENALEGFLVDIPDDLAPALRLIPHVRSVEINQPMSLFADQQYQTPTPSWGLDRIDQTAPFSTDPAYISKYGYKSAGAGSTIYIGDTGIYPHDDLAGRISNVGFSGINDGNGTVDCNGHGTHVATTAAGTTYGVAKAARVVPVRILNCAGSGTYATVLAGLDWILSDQNTNPKNQAVLNLSIGGPASTALNEAILKLTNAGITVVVAAGNNSGDACAVSPAGAPSAITVGATDMLDRLSSYSNRGACVDILAPGTSITAGWIYSASSTRTVQGTSMASPHVAGAAAVYRGLNPGASVAQVAEALTSQATEGVISNLPAGTVNKLLYISPTDGAPLSSAPTIQVKSVDGITSTTADVAVDINPGDAATTAVLEFSTDSTFASGVVGVDLTPTALTGSAVISVAKALSALTPSTKYSIRARANNASGATTSAVLTFTTAAPVVTPPVPLVADATNITGYSATLNGTVVANSNTTTVSFQYGTDPNFVTNTTTLLAAPQTVSGTTASKVSIPVSFLTGKTTYYVRIVAGNSAANVVSNAISFTTPEIVGVAPSVAIVRPAGGLVTPTQAVTGLVNPMGQTTSVRFLFGTESSLTVSPYIVKIPDAITGEETVTVNASMFGLIPGARYYYRYEAFNAAGVTKSEILTNVGNPVMPKVVSLRVSNQTQTTITLNATVNAGGGNTRWVFIYGSDPQLLVDTKTANATPYALTNGYNNIISLPLTGLQAGSTIYYRVKAIAYTGPLAESGQALYSDIAMGQTLNGPQPVKTAQTISFTLPSTKFYGGPGVPLVATASSGLPVTFASSTPSVCKVDVVESSTVLNYVAPVSSASTASCVVIASQSGDATYAAATLSRTIVFAKENTAISNTFTTTDGVVLSSNVKSTSQPLLAEAVDSGAALTFTSTTPGVCSVSNPTYVGGSTVHSTVKVTPLWNGTCWITVSFAGYKYWLPSSQQVSFVVSGMTTPLPGANVPQTITFTQPVAKEFGVPVPLVYKISSGLAVTVTTSTPSICSVTTLADGSWVAQSAEGLSGDKNSCVVTMSQSGNGSFAPAVSVTRTFTWLRKSQSITFALPSTRYFGGPATNLTATASSGLPVTYTVTTPTVCKVVTADGVSTLTHQTPLPTGNSATCGITATQIGDGTYAPAPGYYRNFVFMKETTSTRLIFPKAITVEGSSVDISLTSYVQPTLGEQKGGDKPIVVTSTTPTVCRVESTTVVNEGAIHTRATVRALWNGRCSLTANFAGNEYWLPSANSYSYGITGITTPQPGANAGQTITMSSPTNTAMGTDVRLTATASSKLPVSVTSTTPATCSVLTNSDGTFTIRSASDLSGDANVCTVLATQAGDSSWAPAANATRSFKWLRKTQSITFTMQSSRYYGGAPTNLVATSTSGLPVTFTTTTPAVCEINVVDGKFQVSYVSPLPTTSSANCSVVASQLGDATYQAAPVVTRNMLWVKESTNIKSLLTAPITVTGSIVNFNVVSTSQPALGEFVGTGAAMTVTSLTPKVCVVENPTFVGTSSVHTQVTVKAIWNGTCQLRPVFAGSTYWLPSTTTYAVSVSGMTTPQPGASAPQSIGFVTASTAQYGDNVPLTAKASSLLPVTYATTTPNVCTISVVNGVSVAQSVPGSAADNAICTVIASQAGDDRWAAASNISRNISWSRRGTYINAYTPSVTSKGAGPYVVKGGLLHNTSALNIGSTSGLNIPLSMTTTTPGVCSIGTPSLVSVTGGFQTQVPVTGITNGTCTVTFTFAGDELRKGSTRTFSFVVKGF